MGAPPFSALCTNQAARSGQAPQTAGIGDHMSQNHYTTKTKRRQKNKRRKDPSAATMAKIRQLEAAEKNK